MKVNVEFYMEKMSVNYQFTVNYVLYNLPLMNRIYEKVLGIELEGGGGEGADAGC